MKEHFDNNNPKNYWVLILRFWPKCRQSVHLQRSMELCAISSWSPRHFIGCNVSFSNCRFTIKHVKGTHVNVATAKLTHGNDY